ncbi:MAG: hypothetical protein HPM95_04325 [Alphaproteobacteria bacterium]|nr:hypothetical protein [Alphaproteobacteria bacterium]
MACGVISTGRRLAALGCLAAAILLWPGAADRSARAAETGGLAPRLEALSDEDLDALIDFLDGNVLFTVYHEAGHMLVSELDLPVLRAGGRMRSTRLPPWRCCSRTMPRWITSCRRRCSAGSSASATTRRIWSFTSSTILTRNADTPCCA